MQDQVEMGELRDVRKAIVELALVITDIVDAVVRAVRDVCQYLYRLLERVGAHFISGKQRYLHSKKKRVRMKWRKRMAALFAQAGEERREGWS